MTENYILFFDLETTGLPKTKGFRKYYDPWELEYYEPSRMIEIGYIITDNDGKEIKRNSFLVKPDGFEIKNSFIHGIEQETAENDGLPINQVFDEVLKDFENVSTIVAHNIHFDRNILLSECCRYENKDLYTKIKDCEYKCTMAMGQDYMELKKYPKLVELYKYLFNENFEQEHRSMSDTEHCKKCYFKML